MSNPKRPRCRLCGTTTATQLYNLDERAFECGDVRACGERVGAQRERRRIRAIIAEVRAVWRERMDRRKGFEGSARAVQALDEVLAALKARTK